MQYLQFILEGTSNKQLDAFTKEIVFAIKSTGSVKAGPIPFKGKRMIYAYSINNRAFSKLMAINANKYKKVTKVTLNSLKRPQ